MNTEHVKILRQGVQTWNAWRGENPDVAPDLSGAQFKDAYLLRADLSGANLTGASLRSAYLVSADLTGADLTGADLTDVDLYNADLSSANLTGAIIAPGWMIVPVPAKEATE